jgi:hypothetical protein
MEDTELFEHIKLAQSIPVYSKGTVVIIDNPTDKENLREKVLTQMKEIGPGLLGLPSWRFQYL